MLLVLSLTGLLAMAAESTADAPPSVWSVSPQDEPADTAAQEAPGTDTATETLVDALSDDLGESLLPVIAFMAEPLPAPQPAARSLRDPPFPWTFGLLRPPTALA